MSENIDHAESMQATLWRIARGWRARLWLCVPLPWIGLSIALLLQQRDMRAALVLALVCTLGWLVWAVMDYQRLRARIAFETPRWLDAAVPALEDSSALLDAKAALSPLAQLQRQRLLQRMAGLLTPEDYQAIVRARLPFAPRLVLLNLLLAALVLASQQSPSDALQQMRSALAAAPAPATLELRITPPAYTGVAAYVSVARDLIVPEHSEVRWCFKQADNALSNTVATPVQIELSDGQALTVGAACAVWTARESVFWRRAAQGSSARFNLRVQPDLVPEITVKAPQDLITQLDAASTGVALAIAVRDDHAIVRASLHLTLARGSGENIRFKDREMPLPQSSEVRVRDWQKRWTLAELGMEPGDELYFFVRATDNAPLRPHTMQSPTYTLRLPGPKAEEIESSALPSLVKPESLRSQRQIIIDTEQLIAVMKANPAMPRKVVQDRAQAIAGEQGVLRRRYGQFLGEESTLFADDHGDDHGDAAGMQEGAAKPAIAAEYVHAHDQAESATMFDEATKTILRRALTAMWEAEKQLRAIAPQPALPAEYQALKAIKELQQADRIYLHRTAFVPPALKEEKRLSGDMKDTLNGRRVQDAAVDATPAELRELVLALAANGPLPASWSASAQQWIRERVRNDEEKLAAQRAVQDVADGCSPCRAVLAAHLRATVTEAAIVLQARSEVDTPLRKAWQARTGARP